MDLPAKTRLGPYEIIAAIGAGGMGEVYRARDTRLDRYVAIKILPSHLSCTPELKSRFEREARTLSSVSHPNICHLYDVGCESGVYFLVMELLEGETLSHRLQKGPLPLNDLLRVAIEIADALAKTHRLGLIHRDLKPSNIMLTRTGAKLMDFGLAKPAVGDSFAGETTLPPNGESATTMQSPASPITTSGAIVGTLQYISPEQIEGKEADARSDIFALGAVIYEMATGQRAFNGKSRVAVASAILEKDPPLITALQPAAPPSLAYITSTCLAKDPEERFQTVHDVKLQLRWLTQPGATDSASVGKQTTPRWWRFAVGLAAAIALALIILFVKVASRPAASEHGIVRFSVALPPKQELAADVTQAVAVSPDGQRLAYVVAEGGVSHLYVRRLDQLEPVAIPDSEGANFPFFSPNGDWVAFFNQGKLKKAPADGGLPIALCELPSFFGGTWTPRDVIVVSIPNLGMATVPAVGGALHKVSVATNEIIYPQGLTWLAGGDWVAFTDYLQSRRSIMALKLDSGEVRTLLDNAQSAYYAAGNLVYYQGGALWAVPFDSDKLQILGASAEIEAGVSEENYIPQASVSRTGVLAYAPGPAGNFFRKLFLVNRKGVEQKLDLPPKDYIDPAFSPDGKRIALVIRNVQQLEVIDRERGAVTNLATNFSNSAPTWTPDGKNLLLDAYDASRQRGIYRVAADGSSEPQLLRTISQISHITSIAGDNAAVMVSDPVTTIDLWLLSMHPPYDMRPFKRTPSVERQGALSPDGRWMAYASNESGRSEIYVEPVTGPGGRRQLSNEGGDQPRWVRDGREIIYRNGTKVMSVPVQLRPDFQPDRVVELFDRKFDPGAAVAGYDVSPDGQTFIMTRSEHDNPTEIRVVLGWPVTEQPQK
jgi:serine/threonine protein kinase/Tol biopolymer transport system component